MAEAFGEDSPCPHMNSDFARWVCGSDPAQVAWRTGCGPPPTADDDDEIEEVENDPIDSSDDEAMVPRRYMALLEEHRN